MGCRMGRIRVVVVVVVRIRLQVLAQRLAREVYEGGNLACEELLGEVLSIRATEWLAAVVELRERLESLARTILRAKVDLLVCV